MTATTNTMATEAKDAPASLDAYRKALGSGQNLAQLRGLDTATLGFLRNLAVARFAQGDVDGATESFLYLCVHRHEDPDLWLGLARAAAAAGRTDTARAAYGVAFAQRPGVELALEMLRTSLAAGARAQAAHDLDSWAGAYVAARGKPQARARLDAIAALVRQNTEADA